MKPTLLNEIQYLMTPYLRTGSKTFRRKQISRLMFMLNNIFEHESPTPQDLRQIGRRQVIGFWRRHEHLTQKTRLEYWYVLKWLFERLNKPEPPKPKNHA